MQKLIYSQSNSKNIKDYNKNEIIFSEGDPCNYICYIISGQVKISTSSILYNEFIISTLSEGESFGDNLLFSEQPFYLGTIYATKKTTILFINKKEYLDLISKNLESFLCVSSNKYLVLQQRNKILLQKSIREKILFFLASKSNDFKNNIIEINSKNELASYLNVERPSLSRELIKLKKEQIIDYNKHYIIIKKKPE